jgi:hypothetical protein
MKGRDGWSVEKFLAHSSNRKLTHAIGRKRLIDDPEAVQTGFEEISAQTQETGDTFPRDLSPCVAVPG